jgi:hypothetical protein
MAVLKQQACFISRHTLSAYYALMHSVEIELVSSSHQ